MPADFFLPESRVAQLVAHLNPTFLAAWLLYPAHEHRVRVRLRPILRLRVRPMLRVRVRPILNVASETETESESETGDAGCVNDLLLTTLLVRRQGRVIPRLPSRRPWCAYSPCAAGRRTLLDAAID